MPSKFRFALILVVVALIAVVGCSKSTQANGNASISLASRHDMGACSNLGTIAIQETIYALPSTASLGLDLSFAIDFRPPPGCSFVRWETSGGAAIKNTGAQSTVLTVRGPGALIVVYAGTCCSVGGVVLPTNTYIALAPYLAVIGLVATAGVAVALRKRRN